LIEIEEQLQPHPAFIIVAHRLRPSLGDSMGASMKPGEASATECAGI
jgi:hypothetical protein